jgi:gas vesicle protein
MAKRSNLALLALAASSFAGGLALGLLLSPQSGRDNRKWITDNADQMRHWADEKGKEVAQRGEETLHRFREGFKEGVKHNVPDLYEATEDIDIEGGPIIDG